MPEMHFLIRWPDGSEMRCYSPSLVVREHIEVGHSYPVAEFVARSRTMLGIGSDRVRAKYGYACSSAMDQLAVIEECAAKFPAEAPVVIAAFELPPGSAAPPGPGDAGARREEVGRG
jgi:uncharacterized repeat protein (TIGR04042 family)